MLLQKLFSLNSEHLSIVRLAVLTVIPVMKQRRLFTNVLFPGGRETNIRPASRALKNWAQGMNKHFHMKHASVSSRG